MVFASPGPGSLPSARAARRGGAGKTPPPPRREQGMTSHPIESAAPCRRGGPPVDVTAWRRCRLLEAGFPDDLARVLAGTPSVDLHALLQLVDRGCPPELAARILSPSDQAARPS